MTIKAIHLFDWTTQRVLAWVVEAGMDKIVWLPMADFYVSARVKR